MKRFLGLLIFGFLSFTSLFSHEIKAIVFDCGGVIVKFDHTQVVQFLSDEFGMSPAQFIKSISYEERQALSTGSIDEQVFWENYAKKNHVTLPAHFKDSYFTFIKNNLSPDEELLNFIYHLKACGFQTPMLSDVTQWQGEALQQLGIYDAFCPVLLSYEIGLKKPSIEIYEYLLEYLALPAEVCIFIDDKEENIEAAEKLGINGILYTNLEALKAALEAHGIE